MSFYKTRNIIILFFILITVLFSSAQTNRTDSQSLNNALELVQKGKYLKAIKQLEEITKQHKDFYEAYYLLGKSYYQVQDYKKAEDSLLLSKSLQPDFLPVLLLLSDVSIKQKKFKQAETNLQEASLLTSDKKNIFIRLGNLYLQKQQTNEALIMYKKSYEADKTSIKPLFPVLQIYINHTNYNAALKLITSAEKTSIKNQQDNEQLIQYEKRCLFAQAVKKAEQLFSEHKIKGSLKYYKTADSIYPHREKILAQTALCYYKLRQYKKAEELIDPLIKSGSSLASIYRIKAMILYSEKNSKEALKYINKALIKETENSENYLWAGKITEALHQNRKAEDYYRQAAELDPLSWEAYVNLSVILAKEKKYKDSLTQIETAYNLNSREDIQKFMNRIKGLYYLQTGNTDFDKKAFKSALKNYSLSLQYQYSDTAYINKANTLIELKKYKPAVKMLKKMIKEGKAGSTVYESLAAAYRNSGHQQEAGRIYSALESQKQNNADFYLQTASYYEQNDNLYKAAEAYSNALISAEAKNKKTICRKLARVYYNQGIDLYNSGKIKQAEQKIRLSLSKNSNYAPALEALKTIILSQNEKHIRDLMNQGINYYKQKNYANAAQTFKDVLSLKKDFPSALYNLAETYYAADNYFQAEFTIKQYLTTKADRTEGIILLTRIYLKKHFLEKAKQMLTEELKKERTNSSYYFFLAEIYEQEENIPQALSYYEKSVALNPHNFEARNSLGNLYYQQKQFSKAQEQYTIVLRENPTNDTALYNLAYIYYKKNNFSKAVKLFKKFDRLFPGYKPLYFNLARSLYYQGDYEQSLKYAEKAVTGSDKTNILYQWGMANIYTKLYETAENTKQKEEYRKKSVELCRACIYNGKNPDIADLARGKITETIKNHTYLYRPQYTIPSQYPVLLEKQYLYFYDPQSKLLKKIQKDTEKIIWQRKLSSVPLKQYKLSEGNLYIPLQKTIMILDSRTGLTKYEVPVKTKQFTVLQTGLLIQNQNTEILSFYSNTDKKWSYTNTKPNKKEIHICTSGHHIYIQSFKTIQAVSADSGCLLWSVSAQKKEQFRNTAAAGTLLVFSSSEGKKYYLSAADAFSGNLLWKIKLKTELSKVPIIYKHFIIYQQGKKKLTVLNKNGQKLWTVNFPFEISSLITQNNMLFAGNIKKHIIGYYLTSGKKILDYEISKKDIQKQKLYTLYYKK